MSLRVILSAALLAWSGVAAADAAAPAAPAATAAVAISAAATPAAAPAAPAPSAPSATSAAPAAPLPAPAPVTAVTFLDSKLFDNILAKELGANKPTVEVAISGRMSLNSIPSRIDKWITVVGENGDLTLKPDDPLKPKFVLALLPIVFSMIKQTASEAAFDSAKNYNATLVYHLDRNGESIIDKIVFTKKK